MTIKPRIYNVLHNGEIIRKEITFAQFTRFMGETLKRPDGIALVSEAQAAGYTLKAVATR